MQKSLGLFLLLSIPFLSLSSPLRSQTKLALPGCEPSEQVQKLLDARLDDKLLEKMKFAERESYRQGVLEDAIREYPREILPYQELIASTRSHGPDSFSALQVRFSKFAADHPNDPLALTVGGIALVGKNTPQSIRLLEAAKSKAPDFPWASLQLAKIYFSGKRADNAKTAEYIAAFFSACPASANGTAQWILTKNVALQPEVAAALRSRLEKETDPKRLEEYQTLWGLEFRTRPPAEHQAVRDQMSLDLKRLEALNPNGDVEWRAFLVKGYKQSGASKENVAAVEDDLTKAFPRSQQAHRIAEERWQNAHKQPEDQADKAAWDKYSREYEQAVQEWLGEFTEDTALQRYGWFLAIYPDETIPEKEGLAALNQLLQSSAEYDGSEMQLWAQNMAANYLSDRGWEPTRVIELVNTAMPLHEKQMEPYFEYDNLSADEAKMFSEQKISQNQMFAALLLKAAQQAGKPQAAARIRAMVEGPPPEDKKFLSGYWSNRARLAALDNHKQDALAYYQLALQTREEPPKAWRGKLKDEDMDEAHALWKELGGTEVAWAVWSKPPAANEAQPAEGRWEKPTKEIPTFELSDLSGKTWRLKDLSGKTVLINLWATWCGPCNAELPQLQKFYESVKNRSDIQVLTFNIDEDLGLVAPYLRDKGYTFPVLPAYSVVVSLLDGLAIPQNWVVDSKGTWRWRQIGYDGGTDAEFQKEMLGRLDSLEKTP
ncbi:MAG TPA: TlpA disulfide reductase family protein [Candidatus Sulfotelmatobacter sp.]|nr:TlpA disulfide reductase family protein [Candidatus Sulfotelmatobacter sp.]